MNKREYLEKLLDLCTEKQTDLFYRMYPEGPTKKQLPWAIGQVERTLSGLNSSAEELRFVQKEYKADIESKDKEIKSLEAKIREVSSELSVLYDRFDRMTENPENLENDRVQERLELLDALEAGGVDNWEWYDVAIQEHRKQGD